jgi:hypothetical protein
MTRGNLMGDLFFSFPPHHELIYQHQEVVFPANAIRNIIVSNKFDFSTPLIPAMQVNGPNRTSTLTRFFKPVIFNRASRGYFF